MSMCCFFIETATTEIYTNVHTLSLHDALPIPKSRRRHSRPAVLGSLSRWPLPAASLQRLRTPLLAGEPLRRARRTEHGVVAGQRSRHAVYLHCDAPRLYADDEGQDTVCRGRHPTR